MRVCDICEQQKPGGTRLVSRNGGDVWVCRGCMMQAVTNKADELTYRDW
jgi:Zn-finger protein